MQSFESYTKDNIDNSLRKFENVVTWFTIRTPLLWAQLWSEVADLTWCGRMEIWRKHNWGLAIATVVARSSSMSIELII